MCFVCAHTNTNDKAQSKILSTLFFSIRKLIQWDQCWFTHPPSCLLLTHYNKYAHTHFIPVFYIFFCGIQAFMGACKPKQSCGKSLPTGRPIIRKSPPPFLQPRLSHLKKIKTNKGNNSLSKYWKQSTLGNLHLKI